MQVIYEFVYLDKNGKMEKSRVPIESSVTNDSYMVYKIFKANFSGDILSAKSISGKYPEYIFTPEEKKEKESKTVDGDKIYIYEGLFKKIGCESVRKIRKSYLLPAPALLTDSLIKDFKDLMRSKLDGMGWELLGVTLIKELNPNSMSENDIKEYVSSEETVKMKPEERMVWARIGDGDERISWVPALIKGERVMSPIGDLEDPDSPEDTREFMYCPIPGYKISKKEDSLNKQEYLWAKIICKIYPINGAGLPCSPFLYTNNFIVPEGLSDEEVLDHLMRLVGKFMVGECKIEPCYWEYLSFLPGKVPGEPHFFTKDIVVDDLKVPYLIVSYIPDEKIGVEYSCAILYPLAFGTSIRDYVDNVIKKQFGEKACVTNKEFRNGIISSYSVILLEQTPL